MDIVHSLGYSESMNHQKALDNFYEAIEEARKSLDGLAWELTNLAAELGVGIDENKPGGKV